MKRQKLAILAFGSLRYDPGKIGAYLVSRIKTETPFPVEYSRLSRSRGGAPTLVPHERGARVEAELLILPDQMTFECARDLLWLRERGCEDSGESYIRGAGPNHVLVRVCTNCAAIETVLYTDFNPSGKLILTAQQLAKAAIESVSSASEGKDGISYLMNAIAHGIQTPLTKDYSNAILALTGTDTLAAARAKIATHT